MSNLILNVQNISSLVLMLNHEDTHTPQLPKVLSCCAHRLLVERVFAQYMVPHNLETTERMKCLYYLYATLDPYAVK